MNFDFFKSESGKFYCFGCYWYQILWLTFCCSAFLIEKRTDFSYAMRIEVEFWSLHRLWSVKISNAEVFAWRWLADLSLTKGEQRKNLRCKIIVRKKIGQKTGYEVCERANSTRIDVFKTISRLCDYKFEHWSSSVKHIFGVYTVMWWKKLISVD